MPRERIRRALGETLRREGRTRAEFSVTFVADAEMSSMHERYLGRSGVTDVLAFALHDDGEHPLGDVYVGLAQAYRQAAEAGAEPEEEMVRLAVHGALHVLGYDHPDGPERTASEMFRVQEAITQEAVTKATP